MKKRVPFYYATARIGGIFFKVLSSPAGIYKIYINETAPGPIDSIKLHQDDPYLFDVFTQLREYFNHERKVFNVPLDLKGTDFQLKVWNELLKIPYGQTTSYKELAVKLGGENKSRAVGQANGSNPVPVIVPCHRVINVNGDLGGYACGIKIKEKLLELEGKLSLELFEA